MTITLKLWAKRDTEYCRDNDIFNFNLKLAIFCDNSGRFEQETGVDAILATDSVSWVSAAGVSNISVVTVVTRAPWEGISGVGTFSDSVASVGCAQRDHI